MLSSMLDRCDAMLAGTNARRTAVALALVAAAIRVAWIGVHPVLPDGDERGYMRLAETLAFHHRFAFEPEGPLEAHFGPLVSVLHAVLVVLGVPSFRAGQAVSLLAGSATVGLVYLLGRRVWPRPSAALLAAVAALIHPSMISASRHLYPEALSALALVLAVLALTGSGRGVGLGVGAALGAAALVRREAVVLVPLAVLLVLAFHPGPAGGGARRWRLGQCGLLAATFMLIFVPYLVHVRAATGVWTLSGKANYAWVVGRLMEQRPGEGLSLEEIRRVEAEYPTPIDYLRAQPRETAISLARTTAFHLRSAFFGGTIWPFGLVGLAGLVVAAAAPRLRRWPLPALLMPFVLAAAWSAAGPLLRYSLALAPFVCLLAGAVVLGSVGRLAPRLSRH